MKLGRGGGGGPGPLPLSTPLNAGICFAHIIMSKLYAVRNEVMKLFGYDCIKKGNSSVRVPGRLGCSKGWVFFLEPASHAPAKYLLATS